MLWRYKHTLPRMRGFLICYTRGSRIGAKSRTLWTLADAAKDSHLYGIPRRITLTAGGGLAKLYGLILSDTKVHNRERLLSLVKSRPPGTPLVTVSNHVSTLDDPLMWGIRGLPLADSKLCRWALAAEDICFTNAFFSYFFRLGKCIPVTRGAGIYQPHMAEALERLNDGDWLNTFPEGKISQEGGPLRRLKWGTGSLIARAKVSPIVLPIGHSGFEKMIPEQWWRGKRPPIPLWNKKVDIFIGEPMQFDIPTLKQDAFKWARTSAGVSSSDCGSSNADDRNRPSFGSTGFGPHPLPFGARRSSAFLQTAETLDTMRTDGIHAPLLDGPLLDEAAWRWMYTDITEHIWVALSDVTEKARTLNQSRA
ncbi:hypothetical protein KC19_2G204100 [Ceratodon purpureus]|uniref:Tafazzin family protein n=2 Tax=Ceratodon purpureus TaxID=3225 RepID=A0A8T0IZZ8_CERPU|nr:hypothetical protein KC19_2G204100 [Ceratodon purpureus]